MHVIFVNNTVVPYTHRIFEEVGATIDGELTVMSCAAAEPGRLWKPSVAASYRHIVLPGLRHHVRGNRNIYFNPKIFSEISKLKPDAVFMGGYTPTMSLAAMYCFARGIPVGISFDGWELTDGNSRAQRILRRLITPRCAAGIGASYLATDLLAKRGISPENLFISPIIPAWDAPEIVPGFDARPFDLIWSGAINDFHKGVDFFLETVIDLAKRKPNLSVRILGDGERREHVLKTLTEHNVHLQYDGFLQQHELAEAYASAKIFMFPTRRDTWGLVAHEAAQCGTPTIVSDRAGVAGPLIRNDIEGYILPLEQPAWLNQTAAILDNPALWQRLSTAGRNKTATMTVQASAREMIRAFTCCAQQSKRHNRALQGMEKSA